MLSFDVVTTYAQRHWKGYASRCVSTFNQYWQGVPLTQYEDAKLESESTWLLKFKQRHAWRPTSNYRLDAVRFAHKVAAIELAYASGRGDCLIWLDADCITHAPIDAGWLSSLIGSSDFACLDRVHKYTETGFMIFRRTAACDRLIRDVVDLYKSDRLFDLQEWHDCWAIDHVRGRIEINVASLSGDAADTAHPLINGPLGERLDHLKGKRKAAGKSNPSDLKRKKRAVYWK